MTSNNPRLIFDFTRNESLKNWQVVDDNVMGGVSSGKLSINEEGYGVYEGEVSLDNDGGFSSLRYECGNIPALPTDSIIVTLKGDGKAYQLRIKDKRNTYYSYVASFKTSGKWETITIALKDMYPSFRGQDLNLPNYNKNSIEEIAILIGNKKNETFKLLLDKIEIK